MWLTACLLAGALSSAPTGTVTTIATGFPGRPHGLALDAAQNVLYVCDADTSILHGIDLATNAVSDIPCSLIRYE